MTRHIPYGWAVWRCRIGKITMKPGAYLRCDELCAIWA